MRREIERERNYYLGDSICVITEWAGRLLIDEEAMKSDMLRIKIDRYREEKLGIKGKKDSPTMKTMG